MQSDVTGLSDSFHRLAEELTGRYAVEREPGAGRIAVCLAQDLKNRCRVAVKILRPEFAASLSPAVGAHIHLSLHRIRSPRYPQST